MRPARSSAGQRLRSDGGAAVGSDTLIKTFGMSARQLDSRDRAADRQPGGVRWSVRRDLARADDRQERTRGPSHRRLDVGPGGVGRLLHCHAGARDRRAAVHAHGVDRHLRRQARHRRRLRKARREDRFGQLRPPRRDELAARRYTATRRRRSGSSSRRSTTSSSRRSPSRAAGHPSRSIRSRKAVCGQAGRRKTMASSTRWAASTQPLTWRKSARRFPRTAASSSCRTRRGSPSMSCCRRSSLGAASRRL